MSVIDNFLPKGLPNIVDKGPSRVSKKSVKTKSTSHASRKSNSDKTSEKSSEGSGVKDKVVLSKPAKFSKADIQQKLAEKKAAKTPTPEGDSA